MELIVCSLFYERYTCIQIYCQKSEYHIHGLQVQMKHYDMRREIKCINYSNDEIYFES